MPDLIAKLRCDKLTAGLILAIAVCAVQPGVAEMTSAQEQENGQANPLDAEFPGGISPSNVFAKLDLLDQTIDRIMQASGIAAPQIPADIELGLEPMHVYQIILACNRRLLELDDKLQVIAVPTISARPRNYAPRDVLLLVELMLANVRAIGEELRLESLPADETAVQDKVPTDVFHLGVKVFLKLNALCGFEQPTPNEVYAEMIRADEDVRSMLRQIDPACRYRIDAPLVETELKPGDVFEKCREIRLKLNEFRQRIGMDAVPIPKMTSRDAILPYDVFLQTQIIIAELNLLKLSRNTVSSTPLPQPFTGKLPTDVYNRAEMVLFLLNQLHTD